MKAQRMFWMAMVAMLAMILIMATEVAVDAVMAQGPPPAAAETSTAMDAAEQLEGMPLWYAKVRTDDQLAALMDQYQALLQLQQVRNDKWLAWATETADAHGCTAACRFDFAAAAVIHGPTQVAAGQPPPGEDPQEEESRE